MNNVSVVIPCLNEENYIENCLKSIINQDSDYIKEIIVADYNSNDKSRKICQRYNIKVVQGGTPAKARNIGAKEATGHFILFLDADTLIPKNFINNSIGKFESNRLEIASFYLKPYPNNTLFRITFFIYNYLAMLSSISVLPFLITSGCCLLVSKNTHDRISGFDERFAVLEEYDYIKKIRKTGKFRVLSVPVTTSTRRFTRGNGFRNIISLFKYYFGWLLNRKIDKDKYGYWN